jgi:hypothetical protein
MTGYIFSMASAKATNERISVFFPASRSMLVMSLIRFTESGPEA